MLTNNKKSFVRSIAVLLVLLMVFAMGLVACGNDAPTKEEVETTVAEKLSAALANYISKDDEATVKAIVQKVLTDGNITAEKLDELTKALESYVKADDVAGIVKDVVVEMELDKALNREQVLEILKDYYTAEQINEMMEDYFGNFKPDEVYKILSDAEKAMNREAWDAASDEVIATIEYAQTLINKLYKDDGKPNETYLQKRMQDVNSALADYQLVAFEAVKATSGSTTRTFYELADMKIFTHYVSYIILRQPTVDAMNDFKKALDNACAVLTFEDEQKALAAELKTFGASVAYGSYAGDVFKPSGNKTQVVTLHDKADFYAWNEALDDMLSAYVTDEKSLTETTVNPSDYGLTVQYVYTKTTDTGLDVAIHTTAGTVSGWTYAGPSVAASSDFIYNKFGDKDFDLDAYEDQDQVLNALIPVFENFAPTMMLDEDTYSVETDWNNPSWKEEGLVGQYGYDTRKDSTVADSDLNNKVYSYTTVPTTIKQELPHMKVAREYNAIVAQLTECQIAANEANEAFKTFQHDIIYMSAAASLGTFTDWPDKTTIIYTPVTGNYGAKLVDALTISMCEPGGKIDTYAIFLTDITYKRDSVTEQMEQTMALNNNGTDDPTIGIDEYDLYDAMMSRAYDLLWEKYKTLAFEWADKMLMDYISITYDAEYNNVSKEASPVYTTLPLADFSAKEDDLIAKLRKEGEWADDINLTEGFIDAYYNGLVIADENENDEINIYKLLNVSFVNGGLKNFYINNGKAFYTNLEVGQPLSYGAWYANPLYAIKWSSEDIRDLLTDAMRNVDNAINGAVLEEFKNPLDGSRRVPVQKAFYGFLSDGILNCEEIYDRFLLEDYGTMKYNDMAVLAADIVKFYGAQTDLLEIVEGHLFETSAKATSARNGSKRYFGKVVLDGGKLKSYEGSQDISFVSDTIIDGFYNNQGGVKDNKYYTFGLKSGDFVRKVKANTSVNPYTESEDGKTPQIALEKMVEIDKIYNAAKATVENMVIKANFLFYIDIARGNLDDAAVAYWSTIRANDKDDTARINALNYAKGNGELAIVNMKYYADRDQYALDTYKDEYKSLLSLVSGKDIAGDVHPHLALFKEGKSIEDVITDSKAATPVFAVEVFNEWLYDIASYDHLANCTAATASSGWTLPYASTADYEFVGSAVVELDESVNEDAICECPASCDCTHCD